MKYKNALPGLRAAILLIPALLCAQAPRASLDSGTIHILPIRGGMYMLVGAGGNITLQVGENGMLFVDTGLMPMADKVLAAVQQLSDAPIRYIVNTHAHPDHVGCNEKIAAAGNTVAGGNVVGNIGESAGRGAAVLAYQTVLDRMSAPTGSQSPTPFGAWPTNTFTGPDKKLFFNGEGIDIIHMPAAHTDGDTIVFFRRSDVISTGDIFTASTYPFIDIEGGGSIDGEIDAVNRIIDMIIPVYGQEGGTMIVPGHGRLCDLGDLVDYREMLTVIRDRVRDLIKKGKSLEQIQAAKLTSDYDPEFSSPNAFVTSQKFVEAVYNSLSAGSSSKKK